MTYPIDAESTLVSASPDPVRVKGYLSALKHRHPLDHERLVGDAAILRNLIAVFSYSRFLSDEILKHPDWLDHMEPLDRVLSAGDYAGLLEGAHNSLALAQFRRRQILRILIRDVLGYGALPDITAELSNLADAILDVSLGRVLASLAAKHGMPREGGLSVIALGKLGGQELNYSSDIDLMFVYTSSGVTDGAQPISHKEFYKKVANQFTELLSTYTAEGLCYRVDLRLRPEGSLGEVCHSLDGAKTYYRTRARDWELQMLIKARVSAGDRDCGRELLEAVEPLIYSTTLDFSSVESVAVTRERISEKLNRRRSLKSALDIKLARGGIRDIEFLVQCLQRVHGGRVPWLRHGGTLLALARLNDKDLLSGVEYGRLSAAYRFLRILEHRLQCEDDRQTHTLPLDFHELDVLARRMRTHQLLPELNGHLESVQEIYERVIHAQKPIYYTGVTITSEAQPGPSNLVRFLDEKAPALAKQILASPLLGGPGFERFLEKLFPNAEWLSLLNENGVVARHTLNLFQHSPYLSEQLIRTPELIEEIAHLEDRSQLPPWDSVNDPGALRRLFRREMFRIEAASLCLGTPVFKTLAHTSELADYAIKTAYGMALEDRHKEHRLMVIALGRLGMCEFDLASDADLLFVLPDEDREEHLFWTRVANRMIDMISAYTGDGVMFSVDTRLRPNGGAGALVQCESSYTEYFARHAEAWEGLSYMKSRAVAGDVERATGFLNALQDLDWRRYGQSRRSKNDLRQMRMRLEREQGAKNPLKAGLGGFYDIDFALLYLRLKSAGIFFKVLNMPERIDIIEKIGHLERGDAEFLRDAVTFYRAVDHGLRLYSGHAEGNLPNSEAQIETLTAIVRRWTPDHLNHRPLREQLEQIRNRTREIFDELFS
jgi:glutamate-ammonia-ligase adenylyltransferase